MLFPRRRDFVKQKTKKTKNRWYSFLQLGFDRILPVFIFANYTGKFLDFSEKVYTREKRTLFLYLPSIFATLLLITGVSSLSKCNRHKISVKCNFIKDWPQKRNDLNVSLVYPWNFEGKRHERSYWILFFQLASI